MKNKPEDNSSRVRKSPARKASTKKPSAKKKSVSVKQQSMQTKRTASSARKRKQETPDKDTAGIGAFSGSGVAQLADIVTSSKESQGGEHEHPHVNYPKIYKYLVILLFISVTGPMLGFKVVTLITAFGIAIVKALMVAGFFMHLKFERVYITYLLLTCLLFLFVLFSFIAPDILNHEGANWKKQPDRPVFNIPEPIANPDDSSSSDSAFE